MSKKGGKKPISKQKSPAKNIAEKAKGAGFIERIKSEWGERKPIILFLIAVLGILGAFYWLSAWSFYMNNIFQPAVNAYAWTGSLILNILGQGTNHAGEMISNPEFGMSVSKGCDGIAPIILLAAGIIAFPSPWKYKWKGILFGSLALILLNLIRLVTLFLFGVYTPDLFELMHVEVWQAVFILIAILLWFWWLNWVNRQREEISEEKT